MTGLRKSTSTMKTYHQGTQAIWIPTKPRAWMDWPSHGPSPIYPTRATCVCTPRITGRDSHIPTVCSTGANEDNRQCVCKEQELLLILHEHQLCVLSHAWWNGTWQIQGLEYTKLDRLERIDVPPSHSQPTNGKLRHARRDGTIQQRYIVLKPIPPHWGS